MKRRRVAITGMGLVSSIGLNPEEFWSSLINGVSGVTKIKRFNPEGYRSSVSCTLDLDRFEEIVTEDSGNKDLALKILLTCTDMAIKDCGADLVESYSPERVGILIATSLGNVHTFERFHKTLVEDGYKQINEMDLLTFPVPLLNQAVVDKYGFCGPSCLAMTACSASAIAIGMGLKLLRQGDVDAMIVGGVDVFSEISQAGFSSLRNLEPELNKPFSADRNGIIMGEGGAVFILEDFHQASRKNKRIYTELKGFGVSNDAVDMTIPDLTGESAALCMRRAIADAGLSIKDIDYINAHGTGTKTNDITETLAIKKVFGERAFQIPISSTKASFGHTLGAAGALELAVSVLALNNNIIPPTLNLLNPDPECDLNYVPLKPIPAELRNILSTSYAFGGNNGCLIVGRADENRKEKSADE